MECAFAFYNKGAWRLQMGFAELPNATAQGQVNLRAMAEVEGGEFVREWRFPTQGLGFVKVDCTRDAGNVAQHPIGRTADAAREECGEAR